MCLVVELSTPYGTAELRKFSKSELQYGTSYEYGSTVPV